MAVKAFEEKKRIFLFRQFLMKFLLNIKFEDKIYIDKIYDIKQRFLSLFRIFFMENIVIIKIKKLKIFETKR